MQNCVMNPPPSSLPHSCNVEVGLTHRQPFDSIFNIERGGGREGVFWIKLTPVNVQVSEHFLPGL